jgi:hypothetical protein
LIVEGLIKLLEQNVQVKCRQVDVDIVRSVLSSAKSEYEETMRRETGKTYTVELEVD